MTDPRAPKEIVRADVLAELPARFEEGDGGVNNAIAWVLDELIELDILKNRVPVEWPGDDAEGTVREEPHESGRSLWLRQPNCDEPWLCIFSTALGNVDARASDMSLAGVSKVIGAVPGTPAAEHDPLNFIREIQAIQRTPGESDEQYRKRMIRDGHAHVGDKNVIHPGGFDDCRDCRPERPIREVLPS